MINKIENGSGVGVTVIVEGKPVAFKLAVFARKTLCSSSKEELVYGLVSENGLCHIGSLCSGGSTGFGISTLISTSIPADYRLVAIDLQEMKVLAEQEEKRVEKEKAEYLAKQMAKVARINAFPEKELLFQYAGIDFYARHTPAIFNPGYSRKIQYSVYVVGQTKEGTVPMPIYLSIYKTSNDKLQIKKFAGDMKWKFGKIDLNPKYLLKELDARYVEYIKKLQDI